MSNASLQSRTGRKKRNLPLRHLSAGAAVRTRKPKAAAKAEVYWLERTPVDFYSFDEEYLRRLKRLADEYGVEWCYAPLHYFLNAAR